VLRVVALETAAGGGLQLSTPHPFFVADATDRANVAVALVIA